MDHFDALDIIDKKRRNLLLSDDEITFLINAFVTKALPDYQMAAWLMAVCINGLNLNETIALTRVMVNSGKSYDFTHDLAILADKHSTGGIGDKVTLILGPLMAALGVPMFKISGASLGITGGTLDKLRAIPKMRLELSDQAILAQLKSVGFVLVGQSELLVPADKAIYALRDVTSTVASLPLIAASIMSKKIALGANVILLDIKCGDGAFMKTLDEARDLAKLMQQVGKAFNKQVLWEITAMNQPLGKAVGNDLEVIEAQAFLQDYTQAAQDLKAVVLASAQRLLKAAEPHLSSAQAEQQIKQALTSKLAYQKWLDFVNAQGGDLTLLPSLNSAQVTGKYVADIKAREAGFLMIDSAADFGLTHRALGGLRTSLLTQVDNSAGIYLHVKSGEAVVVGQKLFTLSSNSEITLETSQMLTKAYHISKAIKQVEVILDRG